MLSDHQNLLSTFGKDSESSNRKNKTLQDKYKGKKLALIYDCQPKSKYEQLLSRRKTLTLLQHKQPIYQKNSNKTKKLKTQTDIDYLNNCIRKSISGIAQTICKSKIKLHTNHNSKCSQFVQSHNNSMNKFSKITTESVYSQKYPKHANQVKIRKIQINDKENFDHNNCFQQSKRDNYNVLSKRQYLKNSTKKKANFFGNEDHCPIKSSFSIDLNSQKSSRMQSSRKEYSKKNLYSNYNKIIEDRKGAHQSRDKYEKKKDYKKGYPELKMQQMMEETLKKQLKLLSKSEYQDQPVLLSTRGNKNTKPKQQFLFYDDLESQTQNQNQIVPSQFQHLDSNQIQIKRPFSISKQTKPLEKLPDSTTHKLILAFMKQIQLDYDLRHAKHMFSGIEEPFYAINHDPTKQSKWQRLNKQLQHIGLSYSVDTIKKIFLPSEQQIDPFLSVPQPHQELIYSLIYAYQAAQMHWQQNIYQKWQHWDLRDIQLTIQNIDRDRKGYINVQDIAAFISMQTGSQYKNRDLILIYKRLANGFHSRKYNQQDQDMLNSKQKQKIKFRVLIDSLIKPFSSNKFYQKKRGRVNYELGY